MRPPCRCDVCLPACSFIVITWHCYFFYSEFYEPGSLILEDEGTVIVGLLVGLNVIDANLCIKGEDLDSQVRDGQRRSILYIQLLWLQQSWELQLGETGWTAFIDLKSLFTFNRWQSLTSPCTWKILPTLKRPRSECPTSTALWCLSSRFILMACLKL